MGRNVVFMDANQTIYLSEKKKKAAHSQTTTTTTTWSTETKTFLAGWYGTVFGKACNNHSLLANAVLGMFGRPTCLTRVFPVGKLNIDFLAEQINKTILSIKAAGRTINSLICDNNWANQTRDFFYCMSKFIYNKKYQK